MIQTIVDNATAIFGLIILLGGTIWGIFKYNKKKLRDAFNKGVSEESNINEIEKKVNEAISKVKIVDEKLEDEKKEADIHHNRMYTELSKQGKDIAFIRGKIEKL